MSKHPAKSGWATTNESSMKDAAKFGVGRDLMPPSPYVKIEVAGLWGMSFDLGDIIYQVSDMSNPANIFFGVERTPDFKVGIGCGGTSREVRNLFNRERRANGSNN